MAFYHEILGCNITDDINEISVGYHIPDFLAAQFDGLMKEVHNLSNPNIISILQKLISYFPEVPQLKNYLLIALDLRGKQLKAQQLSEQIFKDHPDYILGRTNLALSYIQKNNHKKAIELLGESFNLQTLYPDRKCFYKFEVNAYLHAIVLYWIEMDEVEKAQTWLTIMKEILPEDLNTKDAEQQLLLLRLKKMNEFTKKEAFSEPAPPKKLNKIVKNKFKYPEFKNPEVLVLYHFGLDLPRKELLNILSLPHDTLASDLEKMLEDSVERFHEWSMLDLENENSYFLIHALLILMEIKAEESLPKVLDFLSYDEEILEFYLGEFVTDHLWQCLYKLGAFQTEKLKSFLLLPAINTYCRTATFEALSYIARKFPERREEILKIFDDLFLAYIEADPEDEIIDEEYLGIAVWDLVDHKMVEMLPKVKILFKKGYVNPKICGTYIEVERDIYGTVNESLLNKEKNVFSIYEEFNQTEISFSERPKISASSQSVLKEVQKVGRNDFCPCGSGKKYKKCCL